MKIAIYADNTMALATGAVCNLLNATCRNIVFKKGARRIQINTEHILRPQTYNSLPKTLINESTTCDNVLIATNIPYENNYFFHSFNGLTIISFSNWNILTDLPITNGFVYFIAAILVRSETIGDVHHENTGCINDFWWDKTGVNLGMRASFICESCRNNYSGATEILDDIGAILDLVSRASRGGEDILELVPDTSKTQANMFDVFLCHNSQDKPAVRKLNVALKSAGISTWFDEEQLEPGAIWQTELEKHIAEVRNACVFVGDSGQGPWQDIEIRAFLNEFVNRGCTVIPVILPETAEIPDLPLFLRQMTWVDLRDENENQLLRLVGSLKNK